MTNESITLSNGCVVELPISTKIVEHMRTTKQTKHMPVEGAVNKSNVPLEYFDWTDDAGRPCVVLLLSGRSTNPLKNKGLLLNKDFWDFLPKYRWSVRKLKGESFGIQCNVNRNMVYLLDYLKEFYKLKGVYLHRLYQGLDCRLQNFTTTKVSCLCGNGSYGVYFDKHNKRWIVQCNKVGDRHVSCHTSKAEAQQAYNAHVMKLKLKDSMDLSLFGRVDGKIEDMFPPEYYENGKLKPVYQAVLDDKPWLIAPIHA